MSARPRVTVSAYPMWRLRLRRGIPRYVFLAVASFGIAASARFAIAPPRPARLATQVARQAVLDRGAEAYAVLFARRYLSWTAEGTSSGPGVQPLAGGALESNAGLVVPGGAAQRVEWAEVVQAREPLDGEHVYTVAAQTDAAGLLYLTVSVVRLASRALALAGYPAFVGPPAAVASPTPAREVAVHDPELEVVLHRALANYLSGSGSELAADLTAGAQVSLPPNPMSLESIQRPTWAQGGAVQVIAQANDGRGVRYTLAYELDVARVRGRWEISAIQTDPRS
jgi:hypothetical protein